VLWVVRSSQDFVTFSFRDGHWGECPPPSLPVESDPFADGVVAILTQGNDHVTAGTPLRSFAPLGTTVVPTDYTVHMARPRPGEKIQLEVWKEGKKVEEYSLPIPFPSSPQFTKSGAGLRAVTAEHEWIWPRANELHVSAFLSRNPPPKNDYAEIVGNAVFLRPHPHPYYLSVSIAALGVPHFAAIASFLVCTRFGVPRLIATL